MHMISYIVLHPTLNKIFIIIIIQVLVICRPTFISTTKHYYRGIPLVPWIPIRPDLVLVTDASLYILELTVGFESNLQINSNRKKALNIYIYIYIYIQGEVKTKIKAKAYFR